MARIWNKPRIAEQSLLRGRHKQIRPLKNGTFSNGAGTPPTRKVIVAMSGGVDSSVAAALLKEQGYFVMGGYMKNFSPESWEGVISKDCPWERDMEDVGKVCDKLRIEWRSFNFEEEYREKVIEYFFHEYAEGRTPNPDVLCNSEIKFGIFLEKAMELGFDYIATGHYVKKIKNKKLKIKNTNQNSKINEDYYKLFQAKDKNKDQSYFLYKLTSYQVSKSIFPLGDLTKPEVRELARKFGLPTAEKKDSQGVCFVGHIKLKDFLKQRIPPKKGFIVDSEGKKIGTHDGAYYYTIGQREGLGLSGGPFYVAKKDVKTNTLVVTKDPIELDENECGIHDVNWISGEGPKFPIKVFAKIRYQSESAPATLFLNLKSLSRTELVLVRDEISPKESPFGDPTGQVNLRLVFDKPQRALAPGQSAVFYSEDEEMLGGGIIESSAVSKI